MTQKEQLKEIDKILKLKGAERWRAVADFTIKINPEIRKQHEQLLVEIEDVRATRANDNGSSPKHRNFRFGLRIPEGVYKAIVGFDVQADGDSILRNPKKSHDDPTGTNKLVRKLARTFPEYKVYKNIEPTEDGYADNNQ